MGPPGNGISLKCRPAGASAFSDPARPSASPQAGATDEGLVAVLLVPRWRGLEGRTFLLHPPVSLCGIQDKMTGMVGSAFDAPLFLAGSSARLGWSGTYLSCIVQFGSLQLISLPRGAGNRPAHTGSEGAWEFGTGPRPVLPKDSASSPLKVIWLGQGLGSDGLPNSNLGYADAAWIVVKLPRWWCRQIPDSQSFSPRDGC